MKILVTGGAGFIGSHIAEYLVQRGDDVTVLDNLSTGKKENLAKINDKINFVNGDIRDYKLLEKLKRQAQERSLKSLQSYQAEHQTHCLSYIYERFFHQKYQKHHQSMQVQ